MIKLKKINERLVKSLTAFTLAITSSFTAVPIVSEIHAKHVIEYSGGIAGTSSGKKEFINRAECHAFAQSYSEFNSYNYSYNLGQLMLKPGVKPGVYYWHYHFNGKELYPGAGRNTNAKHIFFGIPIIVTQNDINKYTSNGSLSSSGMDNYTTIKDNYVKSKTLKK